MTSLTHSPRSRSSDTGLMLLFAATTFIMTAISTANLKITPREDSNQLLFAEDDSTTTYWMTHYPKEEKIVYNEFHFSKETVENTDQLTFTLNIGKTVEINEKLKVK